MNQEIPEVPPKSPREKLLVRVMREQCLEEELEAERVIRAGKVRVNGEVIDKPGTLIAGYAEVTIAAGKDFVGRGALKLQHALIDFDLSPKNCICADVGSSTGGFTEVLLRGGALKVYSIDVGYGELDYRLRIDPRVVVMERTNARHLKDLPDRIQFVTIDVSFISLAKILPSVSLWLAPKADIVALVKPQFEAKRSEVEEGGIVKDVAVHNRVVDEVKNAAESTGFEADGCIESPILGRDGNKEFLLKLKWRQ